MRRPVSMRFWLLIPEMKTSRKTMEWLICFSIINLMLGCLLFKKFKKFNESCSLSKAGRMSSTYLKWNLDLLRLYSFQPLRFVKAHENVSENRSQRRTHGHSINLIIELTVIDKMSLWCNKKKRFFKFFLSDV